MIDSTPSQDKEAIFIANATTADGYDRERRELKVNEVVSFWLLSKDGVPVFDKYTWEYVGEDPKTHMYRLVRPKTLNELTRNGRRS